MPLVMDSPPSKPLRTAPYKQQLLIVNMWALIALLCINTIFWSFRCQITVRCEGVWRILYFTNATYCSCWLILNYWCTFQDVVKTFSCCIFRVRYITTLKYHKAHDGGGGGVVEISSRVPSSTISGFKRKTHKNLDKGGNYEKYFSKRLFSPIVRLSTRSLCAEERR